MASRVKNFLKKENHKAEFPIKLQMLDIRAMDYNPGRRIRRLEPCVSLKVWYATWLHGHMATWLHG